MASLCVHTAMAGGMGTEAVSKLSWLASISGGPVWERAGKTQTFYLAPEIEKTYYAKKSTSSLAYGELFLGMQKDFYNQLQAQIGLALAATDKAKLSGEIWDDADPQFDNYVYKYKIKHRRVALKGKLLFDRNYVVIPWVSGSVGVGFNKAYGFDNTPTIFEAVKNANFTNNTKTAFTYTLGAGLQKALTECWQVGIGYEFADWGKSQLGRSAGQTLNQGLSLNHLYTHGVLLNVTYIA
ncbi:MULTISPECIES: outer membrane protein [unclassified Legionella]|uniref:outer membrane protein n=1 Tax=unclassified Legionella TaxID=2622702 RepID=UPI00105531EE|nr:MULTISPECIES: porin family protein [unclassified Legionella]MDI9819845.1 porin family protein [Legionella sp. PL877]